MLLLPQLDRGRLFVLWTQLKFLTLSRIFTFIDSFERLLVVCVAIPWPQLRLGPEFRVFFIPTLTLFPHLLKSPLHVLDSLLHLLILRLQLAYDAQIRHCAYSNIFLDWHR